MTAANRPDAPYHRHFGRTASCGRGSYMLYLEVGCGFLLPCIIRSSLHLAEGAISRCLGGVA
jgi:hypothetical protein